VKSFWRADGPARGLTFDRFTGNTPKELTAVRTVGTAWPAIQILHDSAHWPVLKTCNGLFSSTINPLDGVCEQARLVYEIGTAKGGTPPPIKLVQNRDVAGHYDDEAA
jgi:hypothetical protein